MSKKELEYKEFSMFSDVFDCCNIDDDIEVYDIQTKEDLAKLKEQLCKVYLENMQEHLLSEEQISEEIDYVLSDVTVGHKVFIFWNCYNYNYFGCYTYGNGSYEDCYKEIVGQVEENLKRIKERLDK